MDDFARNIAFNSVSEEPLAPQPPCENSIKHLDFKGIHPFVYQTVIDKIYGCIIGSALGDAIGLYTEFLTKAQSAQVYPKPKFQLIEPATEFHSDSHRLRFERCAWTDDTDQALLIILGYLHAHTSIPFTLSVKELSQDFAVRLHIWISQGLLALDRYACGIGALVGGTVQSKNYLSDPVGTAIQRWVHSGRYQAPNGSLMRTHPIGVIGVGMSEVETFELSVGIGRTTHVDPRCVVSCCIQVALIRGLIRGEILDEVDVDACIERSFDWVKGQPEVMNPGLDEKLTENDIERHVEREEFARHVYAKTLEELKLDEHNKIGYVYKCLGSAIVLLRLAMEKIATQIVVDGPLAAETMFEDLIVDLIMEGGDADTNGSAAAALLGAYLGYAKLPSHWTLGLAHKEWLIKKTGRLITACGVVKGLLQPEKDEASNGGIGLRTSKELEHRWALLIADISRKTHNAREAAVDTKEKKKGMARWFAKS